MTRPSSTDNRSFLVGLLAAFTVLVALIVRPFLSFLLGVLLLAFVLYPVHRRLEPRIGARPSAAILVTAALLGVVVPLAVVIVTLPEEAANLSSAVRRIGELQRIECRLEAFLGVDLPLESIIADVPRRIADLLVGDLSNLARAVVHAFLGIVLSVFLLYYLLKDGRRTFAWLQQMTPLDRELQDELYDEISSTTWAVLEGHVLVAAVQGIVAGIGLLVVGIPHVVFWTFVMMILELFPIVGVAAVLGPAVLYLGITGRFLAAGFLLVYGLTAVALVDDYLRAYLIDRESSLHSAIILLGVFGGVYVFGAMGLFYGPIIIGVFAALVRLFNEHVVTGD